MDLARMQRDKASEGAVFLDDDEDASSPSKLTRLWQPLLSAAGIGSVGVVARSVHLEKPPFIGKSG